jgi:hypothetical protein
MNILLRTLTRKSKFNLGKNKELTVQRIIDLNKKIDLISAYYKLSKFNYTKDILDELGIVDEWVILKPSKNEDLYYKFLKHINYNYRSNIISGADKMKRPLKTCFSKGYLQNINQKK